ncbi:MAG: hypothetical protein M1830_004039 [Pleopsidium flavum]|nr:MAG: hypothetical protein M1830_004039 [Pleopsidium flavum]
MVSAGNGGAPKESDEKALQHQNTQPLPQQAVTSLEALSSASKRTTSSTAQNLINYVLHFLSVASNETLGTCILALGTATYLVLGRVGLVLIGVIAGILLHATWEGNTGSGGDGEVKDPEYEYRRRRELGLDVVARVLDWRQRQATRSGDHENGGTDVDVLSLSQGQLDFADFQPATGTALTQLVDAIIRDYIHELSAALMTVGSPALPAAEAVEVYLRKNPESNLANMLSSNQQRKKLKSVANDILQNLLDARVYDCEPARVFLRELLAGVVLEMTVQSCSKAEWINGWILCLLEEGEPEFMNAIDAGVGGAAANEDRNAPACTLANQDHRDATGSRNSADLGTSGDEDLIQRTCKAEDSVEEATLEVRQLNELIAAEDARRGQEQRPSGDYDAGPSDRTINGPARRGSSQSDLYLDDRTLLEASNVEDARSEESASATSDTGSASTFTSFDQILPTQALAALTSVATQTPAAAPAHLALQDANISIFDDSLPGEKSNIRAKPTADYLLQVEPASSQHPGWMIARKYADFETLHEVLRRISVVSGITSFAERHSSLPGWKGQTRSSLREGLERYIQDALTYNRLAESEGMKRFFDKDQGLGKTTSSAYGKVGFGFPSPAAFETMGKGMLDVLSSAPKGAAGGGKTLLGGVTGVLGGVGSIGQRKAASMDNPGGVHRDDGRSSSSLPLKNSMSSMSTAVGDDRGGFDVDPSKISPLPRRLTDTKSNASKADVLPPKRPLHSARRYEGENPAGPGHQDSSTLNIPREALHFPPPPSDIPDDYGSLTQSSRLSSSSNDHSTVHSSSSTAPTSSLSASHTATSSSLKSPCTTSMAPTPSIRKSNDAMTEKETQITVELLFAVISELYTLSSAWNIRRTLLNAARTYLLRPGNPNLEAIRLLLQNSIIDSNTSDAGLAAHIQKVRESALPTDEERKAWPEPPSDEEKETLRRKARKLLVERGMPQALTSIMGAAASSEALGRVFDCLQDEDVARGLMFALVLQGIKAATQ